MQAATASFSTFSGLAVARPLKAASAVQPAAALPRSGKPGVLRARLGNALLLAPPLG